MELHVIIRELRKELGRIDRVIGALENHGAVAVRKGGPGRKFMDSAARQEVSIRMKNYWAKRRAQESAANRDDDSGSAMSATAA